MYSNYFFPVLKNTLDLSKFFFSLLFSIFPLFPWKKKEKNQIEAPASVESQLVHHVRNNN